MFLTAMDLLDMYGNLFFKIERNLWIVLEIDKLVVSPFPCCDDILTKMGKLLFQCLMFTPLSFGQRCF